MVFTFLGIKMNVPTDYYVHCVKKNGGNFRVYFDSYRAAVDFLKVNSVDEMTLYCRTSNGWSKQ